MFLPHLLLIFSPLGKHPPGYYHAQALSLRAIAIMSPMKHHLRKLTKTFRRSASRKKRSIDWVTTFENLTFPNPRPKARSLPAANPCEIGQSDSARSFPHLHPEARTLLAENLFEKRQSDSARHSPHLGPEAHPFLTVDLFEDEQPDSARCSLLLRPKARPLLATNLFEDEQSDSISVISDVMASSRFSTYTDPALALFSRLPESKVRTFRSNSIPSSAPFMVASHGLGALVLHELANQVLFRSMYSTKRHADCKICAGLYKKASEATGNRDS